MFLWLHYPEYCWLWYESGFCFCWSTTRLSHERVLPFLQRFLSFFRFVEKSVSSYNNVYLHIILCCKAGRIKYGFFCLIHNKFKTDYTQPPFSALPFSEWPNRLAFQCNKFQINAFSFLVWNSNEWKKFCAMNFGMLEICLCMQCMRTTRLTYAIPKSPFRTKFNDNPDNHWDEWNCSDRFRIN